MPHEFTGFKAQARKAGYTVRKAVPVKLDLSADDLIAELMA
jgi:hypothetical protein